MDNLIFNKLLISWDIFEHHSLGNILCINLYRNNSTTTSKKLDIEKKDCKMRKNILQISRDVL